MEARLLADEHFDVRIVAELRAKGHDVVTVRQLNESKSGDGWSDDDVLAEGTRLNRVILTENIKDFRKLHESVPWHEGIVVCVVERDSRKKADRIDTLLRDLMREKNNPRLTGEWIDARPQE